MDILRLPSSLRRVLITQSRLIPSCTRALSAKPHTTSEASQTETRLSVPSEVLNDYATSHPPNSAQLSYASNFFQHDAPNILFTAYYFRSFPQSTHPEVAFLGRSNVGKSSLLNALFGRTNERHAYVSKKPGKTRTMNGFGVGGEGMGAAPLEGEKDATWKRFGKGGVVVVDMPGYGGGSREEWGKEALKYLTQRKQLRRTFVLIDSEHGLKNSDIALLTHLRKEGVAYSVVMSKVDKLLHPTSKVPGPQRLGNALAKLSKARDDVRAELKDAFNDGRDVSDDILCCSAEKSLDERSGWRSKLGVDELRWAVLNACGLESDETGAPKRKMRMRDVKMVEEAPKAAVREPKSPRKPDGKDDQATRQSKVSWKPSD
ncbi:hypothetical protein Q7P37_007849 [Cladosporium fusiforme]